MREAQTPRSVSGGCFTTTVSQVQPDRMELRVVERLTSLMDARGYVHRGSEPGARDFDLRVEGEADHAVEVTSIRFGQVEEFLAASRRHDIPGHGLVRSWMLYMPPSTNANQMAARGRQVVDALRVLEDADEPGFRFADSGVVYPLRQRALTVGGALSTLKSLGVVGAEPFTARSSPAVHLSADIDDTSDSDFVAAVEAELGKIDNRRKLAASDAAHRHLAVVVDFIGRLDLMPARFDALPSTVPNFPAEITHLWVLWPSRGAAAWSCSTVGWRLWPVPTVESGDDPPRGWVAHARTALRKTTSG